ncbi:hypothetical protein CCH79_00002758, partial [Gambusia affinis]
MALRPERHLDMSAALLALPVSYRYGQKVKFILVFQQPKDQRCLKSSFCGVAPSAGGVPQQTKDSKGSIKRYTTSSSRLKSTKARPTAPLGSRILTNPDDIFKHNMWDHVQWTKEDQEVARERAEENSSIRIPLTEQGKFSTDACQYWDQFYEVHQDKFFKDRRWLFLEFPELLPSSAEEKRTNACRSHQVAAEPASSCSRTNGETGHTQHNDPIQHCQKQIPFISRKQQQNQMKPSDKSLLFLDSRRLSEFWRLDVELVTVYFPLNTDSFLYCCDFSARAIQLVKDHPDYDDSVCHAFVHDICEEADSFPFPPQSLDAILAVFVLSSIHPQRVQKVVNQLSTYLKHGGVFLFRDYGRYDLSQLRFKKGRCLSDNFYTRGDGTCVYFFTKGIGNDLKLYVLLPSIQYSDEEVHNLFSIAGLEEIQNLEDKRLQVNRGKKVAMRRVWMQSKYRKPPLPHDCGHRHARSDRTHPLHEKNFCTRCVTFHRQPLEDGERWPWSPDALL